MSLQAVLKDLEDLEGRVGPEGLYLRDGTITLILPEWRSSPIWNRIGETILTHQSLTEGVVIRSILDGAISRGSGSFPGLKYLDEQIRQNFQGSQVDLLEQFRQANVLIKLTPETDYALFIYKDWEVPVELNYVKLLIELGARMTPPESSEETLSFVGPDFAGFVHQAEIQEALDEGPCESVEECQQYLTEFEEMYTKARRSPHFWNRNGEVWKDLRQNFVETLFQIGGYEKHGDRDFNKTIDDYMAELFPSVTIRGGITFPIKGKGDLFETVHPERLMFVEEAGDSCSVFVADWDNGYGDHLGTYIPVEPKIAEFLMNKVPHLKVRA
jgi:hypothetical protein